MRGACNKAGGPGDASLGMLFRRLALVPAVTTAERRGTQLSGGRFVLDARTGCSFQDSSLYASSLARKAAPTTPARGPSSDMTIGRLPVARGSERL